LVNFKNTIIIMTSNIGSSLIRENFEKFTTENREQVIENTKVQVLDLLKQTIRPEFLNRIDDVIMFTPLDESEIAHIVELQLKGVIELLSGNGFVLSYTPAVLQFIAKEGFDPQFGARPVKRVIQRYVLNELSKAILSQSVDKSKPILIDVADGTLIFK